MRYLVLVICMFFLIGCWSNVRQSIGISGKPLSTNAEQGIKMNYKIIFGKVRPKEDDD